MTANKATLDERRKRALYRACHRGTKEMDWLLGRYAKAKLASMGGDELEVFERLMSLPDPDIEHWITHAPQAGPIEVWGIVGQLRAFHDIEA